VTVGFLLDTNVISELVRHPQVGLPIGLQQWANSMFVPASSWRQNCAMEPVRKASVRLAAQLEAVLAAIDVLALETPVDSIYVN
jgi:tRNA(fMet)-specific endonuclease VapC